MPRYFLQRFLIYWSLQVLGGDGYFLQLIVLGVAEPRLHLQNLQLQAGHIVFCMMELPSKELKVLQRYSFNLFITYSSEAKIAVTISQKEDT